MKKPFIVLTGSSNCEVMCGELVENTVSTMVGKAYVVKKIESEEQLEKMCERAGIKEVFIVPNICEVHIEYIEKLRQKGYGVVALGPNIACKADYYMCSISSNGVHLTYNSERYDMLYNEAVAYEHSYKELNRIASNMCLDFLCYIDRIEHNKRSHGASVGIENGRLKMVTIPKIGTALGRTITRVQDSWHKEGESDYFILDCNKEYGASIIKHVWSGKHKGEADYFIKHIKSIEKLRVEIKRIVPNYCITSIDEKGFIDIAFQYESKRYTDIEEVAKKISRLIDEIVY